MYGELKNGLRTQETRWLTPDAGARLVAENHQGSLLQLIGDRLYCEAPTPEVIAAKIAEAEGREVTPTTGEAIAKGWRAMLQEVLKEPY